jgi:hypothetical protein
MWIWKRRPAPLRGGPVTRRMKCYSAESGYAYQYFYLGWRPVEGATEYVFEVSAGGKAAWQTPVRVESAALTAWEREHARELSAPERYAVAKLALMDAFDTRPDPAAMTEPVPVDAARAAEILSRLGRD